MEKVLVRIYRYFDTHRPVFLTCFIGSFLLLGWFASRVHFEEDISKVLPKDPNVEKLNEVFRNSRFTERLVIMVSMKDSSARPDSLTAYAADLADGIRLKVGPYISRLTDKVDDSLTTSLFYTIGDHLPVFLDSADFTGIDSLITPEGLSSTLAANYKTLSSPAGLALKSMIVHDPVGITFLGLKKLRRLQYDDNFELYDQYVLTKDHCYLLMFLTPRYPVNNTGMNARLLNGIDAIRDSLGARNASATYFGAVAVSVGNALQLRKDTIITQGVTVIFLIIFIALYFHKKRAPIVILVPVLFGSLFALAAVYLIRGSISVIALGSGSVILGVAVNYSLHVFNHHRHRRDTASVIRDLAFPLTIGSFTTIGGFFCLEFVQSEMLRDLGLFAAFSLIGASFCSLVFLPHFLPKEPARARRKAAEPARPAQDAVADPAPAIHPAAGAGSAPAGPAQDAETAGSAQDAVADEADARLSWIDRLATLRPEYNRYLMILILVATVVFAWQAPKVGFEADLNKMNYMSPSLKAAEATLRKISVFSYQSVYVVTEGKDLNQALETGEKVDEQVDDLVRKGVVKKYSGVSSLLLSDSLQRLRIDRWNRYWAPAKKALLLKNLDVAATAQGFKPGAFNAFATVLDTPYAPVDRATLDQVRRSYLDDYITETPGKAQVVTLVKVTPEGRQAVYDRFAGTPGVAVLDRQYLTAKFIDLINNDFGSIAWMSALLVFTVLLLTYGRIELTLMSFIPMVITFLWILGIMALLKVDFNIINIIISAFIFGMGDDYSLFIMDGLLQEYKTGKKNLDSYKSSIFLSAITTMAGLGVLIFAGHPALRSIAIISIVGMLCVVVLSQIVIPFLFKVLIADRVSKGRFPWTLSGFLKTLVSYTYFVLGSLLLTLIGLILVKLRPFGKRRSKYCFHVIKSAFIRSLIYVMVNVRKKIINPLGEDFSKPALVIVNHQSFLDSLLIQMQYPKLLLLTNSWVWHSPVMGGIVRLADYYPIMHGAEGSVDLLRQKVAEGYSIVVFPEGSRSRDGQIRRFHKGAFYLAQELGLDILPIMLHGSGYTITKGDFLLKDGRITIKFLPRIPAGAAPPAAIDLGAASYSDRAKAVARYFREQFATFSEECEQPRYYRELLLYNYIYKGPVLEWYMRVKTAMEDNYQLFHDLLPRQGDILDIGCGYGFMSYFLSMCAKDRRITAFDYDEDKVEVAAHAFLASGAVPAGGERTPVRWLQADATTYEFDRSYHGIVLADMLHYLQPDDRQVLVRRCIRHLSPGGVLLIRDGDKDLQKRHRGTRFTEWFSTRFYGFNKTTKAGLSFFSFSVIRDIATEMGMECQPIDNTTFTSNVIYVIRHRQ
ncbi:trifunctional MMPL family transporter/lysophospholipid acyltransferase/class I SAM-dependent methyltransferase [Dinghuibacter silviterrae]|uniref:1-acyl-sn-glycerol-3-phosphate acyltransferase n=1 Tax=Dinghuibacter silviterrae TaxID=1539049 RepID=A0A4R8DW47_9BACT|nr:trifunctional MMPL family transporter/lysophospholipid acyltransferase/class I SAM-dependent methyltransferase [Dinghuibacter silviterrae]TDX02296.1 1-acyl-sn-glycerol-3-phosphate acyltransferase [Dinghuibacter silviterrae]